MESLAENCALHEIFLQTAAAFPERIAVIHGGREITYAELERLSSKIAAQLQASGVRRGHRVGLWMPRGLGASAAILGILRSGAAYVPMDAEYPADRARMILSDAGATALVTNSTLSNLIQDVLLPRLLLDDGWENVPCPNFRRIETRPDDIAYIIFTSGSTGRPKGVPIPHRCVCHLVNAEAQVLPVTPEDRVFQGFSIAFDASVEEFWLAWRNGAALLPSDAELLRDGRSLAKELTRLGVTVLSCAPTLLAMIEEDIPTVRLLIVGGEACPAGLVNRWARNGRRMVNTYGPTEATVVATWHDLQVGAPVRIGRPLPGYEVAVIDASLSRMPEGQPGELAIGGPCLTPGYLDRPDLDGEKFFPASWQDGARWYRTGDQARFDENGALEFLGRMDDQVKLRGFRIELGEIESALLSCEGIAAAAATVRQDASGADFLAAYVTLRRGESFDETGLRAQLRQQLPAYMTPTVIAVVATLPTLPSGKVNRKALPDVSRTAANAAPRTTPAHFTPAQKAVFEMWAQFFPGYDFGLDDDFFHLGGHSLLATRLVSDLRKNPQWSAIGVGDVYQHRTFGAFAAFLASLESTPASKSAAAPSQQVPPAPVSRLRHFLCGTAQLISLYPLTLLGSPVWLSAFLIWDEMVTREMRFQLFTAILVAVSLVFNMLPAQMLICVLTKWLILGRIKPGRYRLWGLYYFRFWLVQHIHGMFKMTHLRSTPFIGFYYRLLGAKIGRNVHLASSNFSAYDVVTIGNNTSVGHDAALYGYTIEDGWLIIGPVFIGENCFVGTRVLLSCNTRLEDGAELLDGSMLPADATVPARERWQGSPARRIDAAFENDWPPDDAPHPASRLGLRLAYAAGLFLISLIPTLAVIPSAVFIGWVEENVDFYPDEGGSFFATYQEFWKLLIAAPVSAFLYIVGLCLVIALAKRIVIGRVKPGVYPLRGYWHVRKWFADCLMNLSLELLFPLYASVYLPPWLRMLGAKLGRNAEISTAENLNPDLVELGDGTFVADAVCLGASEVRRGWVRLRPVKVGEKSFLGNNAVIPGGTEIGPESLVGVLSSPPQDRKAALKRDGSWLGLPSFELPHRIRHTGFGDERTYQPTRWLRFLRATIEFIRIILPNTIGFIVVFAMFLLFSDYSERNELDYAGTIFMFPLFLLAAGAVCMLIVILLKWIIVGHYKPQERPLWSHFVWRTELVATLHEHLAVPSLAGALSGTPMMPWYLRLLGAKIGKRCCLQTIYFTEFDLVHLGDDVVLNAHCDPQTHLFEDRVMKMSHITIGARCSVGAFAVVLYDSEMKPGSKLDGLSLLMKGETLPENTRWQGSPARLAGCVTAASAKPESP